MKRDENTTFHMGIDYACVMLPSQTTENPIARIYGTSEEVRHYGERFAHSGAMLAALETIARGEISEFAIIDLAVRTVVATRAAMSNKG